MRDLDARQALVLLSAVFFRGDWRLRFDPRETRAAPFHALDGAARPLPLMHRSGDFGYASNRHFAAVRLPFWPGSFELHILLPHTPCHPADLLGRFGGLALLRRVLGSLREREGLVGLPRCTIHAQAELTGALGITAGFGSRRRAV